MEAGGGGGEEADLRSTAAALVAATGSQLPAKRSPCPCCADPATCCLPPSPCPPLPTPPLPGWRTCGACWRVWAWRCTTQWQRSCASTSRWVLLPGWLPACLSVWLAGRLAGCCAALPLLTLAELAPALHMTMCAKVSQGTPACTHLTAVTRAPVLTGLAGWLAGWLCWVQDATGRYKNERVQYMRLCETETEAPAEEKTLPPPAEPAQAAAAPAPAATAAAGGAAGAGAAAAGEGAAVKADTNGGEAARAEAPSAAATAAAAEGVQAEGEAQAAAAAVAGDAEMAETPPTSPAAAAAPAEAAAAEGAAEGAADGATEGAAEVTAGGASSAEKVGLAAEVAALNVTVRVPPAERCAGWLADRLAGCCQMHSWSNQLSAASCMPGCATTSFTRANCLPVTSPPTPRTPCWPPHPASSLTLQGLAAGGKLASLTVAQLTKYLHLHGLPTGGKKAEIMSRIAEHARQQQH